MTNLCITYAIVDVSYPPQCKFVMTVNMQRAAVNNFSALFSDACLRCQTENKQEECVGMSVHNSSVNKINKTPDKSDCGSLKCGKCNA